jgi:hypothetical protein
MRDPHGAAARSLPAFRHAVAGALGRVARGGRRLLALAVAAWALCGVSASCAAGLLAHPCSQDGCEACGHETVCAEDPCSASYVRPDPAPAPAPGVVALASTFEAASPTAFRIEPPPAAPCAPWPRGPAHAVPLRL